MQKKQSDLPRFYFLYSFLVLSLFFFSGCTISNDYGPYKGKVVDAETNEPVEGAVVLLKFHTIFQLSPGGAVYKYADALEVMTDTNGEFSIPAYTVEAFRLFHKWDPYEDVTIFKPGYGVFPEHPESVSDSSRGRRLLAENKYITVKFPKLKTLEEHKQNIRDLHIPKFDVPYEKQKNLLLIGNKERKRLGLEPVGVK